MKKLLLPLLVIVMLLGIVATTPADSNTYVAVPQNGKWEKMKDPIWVGKSNGTVFWYKIENGKLFSSTDNVKWSPAESGTWSDIDGKWYRVDNRNLLSSPDGGNTWDNFPARTWRASDGTWYMFDDNWLLWTGGTGTTAPEMPKTK